jgi:hypothetical protein
MVQRSLSKGTIIPVMLSVSGDRIEFAHYFVIWVFCCWCRKIPTLVSICLCLFGFSLYCMLLGLFFLRSNMHLLNHQCTYAHTSPHGKGRSATCIEQELRARAGECSMTASVALELWRQGCVCRATQGWGFALAHPSSANQAGTGQGSTPAPQSAGHALDETEWVQGPFPQLKSKARWRGWVMLTKSR